MDDESLDELLNDHHDHSMTQAARDTEIENHKFENSAEIQTQLQAQEAEAAMNQEMAQVEANNKHEIAKIDSDNKHKVNIEKAKNQEKAAPKALPGSARHSRQSSIQPGNGDPRKSDKAVRKQKQADKESQAKKNKK